MEIVFGFIVWILAASYSLYNVHVFTTNIYLKHNLTDDLKEGWSFLWGTYRDSSDYEWNSWKQFALSLLPWIATHILGAEFFRNVENILGHNFVIYKKYVKHWYCFVSFGFIIYTFGTAALLILIIQPIIYLFVLKISEKTEAVWICTCLFLIITNILKNMYANIQNPISFTSMTDEDLYMILITILWTQLRCISYSLDIIILNKSSHLGDKKENRQKIPPTLLDLMSYTFYLPLLFFGPLILYEDFNKSVCSTHKKSFLERLKNFSFNLSSYLWWMIFMELCLHFIYFNALQYHIEVFHLMSDWCLYGGGLWMGLYFYLKYLTIYGIAGSFAALDAITPERPPRCIARVHRYSQMWKYFDVGLYKFLIKYIFKPTLKSTSNKSASGQILTRCLGSLLCFLFVFLWHGAHYFILIWTIFNFVGIILENLGRTISESDIYKSIIKKYKISDIAIERMNALLSIPVLIISAVSNFYFFAGSEIGEFYVNRIKSQSFATFFTIIFILYNSCRASQYLNDVHARSIKV